MNRLAVCGFLVGLGVICPAQDLAKKITVEIPALRATKALEELGKAAGITMQPGGNLKNDVFVISAHDATVDDIMQRVAQAESGRWIQQSGVYILTRDSSTGVAQERAELKARADSVAKAVAKLTASIKKQPAFNQASAQKLAEDTQRTLDAATSGERRPIDISSSAEKTPSARAIARVLASIDPIKLAQIGLNQRVVFSTQPTSMQQSMNAKGDEAFRDFVAEQVMYSEAYNTIQPQDPNNRRMVIMNGFGTPTMGNGNPKLGLGVGLLVVQCRFEGRLDVQMIAADPNLDTLATGGYTLNLTPGAPTPTPLEGEQPLKISDQAQEMAKALFGAALNRGAAEQGAVKMMAVSTSPGGGDFSFVTSGGNSSIKISPELKARVLNPEKFEPMAFAPGEAMLAYSRQSGKNVVALLPDSCFGSFNRQFANDVTPSKLLSSLPALHSLSAKQDGDWLVVSPASPFSGRATTVDRSALGVLLRAMDKAGSIRLDDISAFATSQTKVPGISDFDILYPRLINTSSTDRDLMPLAMGSISMYRFYGSLSDGQRRALADGSQIPFMNLSQQQLDLVAEMVFNSPQGPTVRSDPRQGAPQATSMTFTSANGAMPMMMGGPSSAKTERTIMLPNGITHDGFLNGGIITTEVVQAINSGTGSSTFLDPQSIAFTRSMAGQPEFASFGNTPQYDRYRMAQQTKITLSFNLSPRMIFARSLSDSAPNRDAEATPYDSLPATFRQKVDQIADQLKNAIGNGRVGIGRQSPPPPSREM